jgi:DNA-binding NarL/FixJ family response regulator
MTRLLIVDDHPVFRDGLAGLLATLDEVEIVGSVGTANEAVETVQLSAPDVVLMDLNLPGSSGVEATRQILDLAPSTAVLVITMVDDDDSVIAALRAGARGYVLKDADEDELTGAIRAVARGEAIFSSAVAGRVLAYFAVPRPAPKVFPSLTDREREILDLIAAGHPNPSIARTLSLSPKTVANYVSAIFAKLQVADRAEAMVRAREAGLGS